MRTALIVTLAATLLASPASLAGDDAEEGFSRWLKALKSEGKKQGLSEKTLAVLDGVALSPRVIELSKKQPEFTLTFEQYVARVVSTERVERGRALLAEHRALLDTLSARYGVQPEYIVALWGTETKYGAITGDHPLVPALATLAYQGRRKSFFRKELLAALRILDQGHVAPADFKGSWAGAMGQCQFMPTTFLAYAADGDGDGKKDLWGSLPDVFASAAHYLSKLRWDGKRRWGQEVVLPEGFDAALVDLSVRKSAQAWRGLKVAAAQGASLEEDVKDASLVRPGGQTTRTFLVYGNFRALMRWNRSQYFAAAVGLLADELTR